MSNKTRQSKLKQYKAKKKKKQRKVFGAIRAAAPWRVVTHHSQTAGVRHLVKRPWKCDL